MSQEVLVAYDVYVHIVCVFSLLMRVKTGTLKNLKKLEQVMDILNKVPKNITFHFINLFANI